MNEVTLLPAELLVAAQVGVMRQVRAIRDRLPDRHGFEGPGWNVHIEGACGELAAAKVIGAYWPPTLGRFKASFDVGGRFQIRTASSHEFLIIRDGDPEAVYILVTGAAPCYMVHGWIRASEAKRHPEWRRAPGNRPAAFFVPKAALAPLEHLRVLA